MHTRQRWLGREYLIDATGVDAEPYLLTVRDADGREYRSDHQSWQVAQKESWHRPIRPCKNCHQFVQQTLCHVANDRHVPKLG